MIWMFGEECLLKEVKLADGGIKMEIDIIAKMTKHQKSCSANANGRIM